MAWGWAIATCPPFPFFQVVGAALLVATAAGYAVGARYLRNMGSFAEGASRDASALMPRRARAAADSLPAASVAPAQPTDIEFIPFSPTEIPLAAQTAARHFDARGAQQPSLRPNVRDDEEFEDEVVAVMAEPPAALHRESRA